jgi:HPt (histidine-containing phosphotransfer) domain-containing protein
MTANIIDDKYALDQYLELMGNEGPSFIIDLIDSFLDDSVPQLNLLEDSLQENDYFSFRKAAHSLKSSCAIVGANKLATRFTSLEKTFQTENRLRLRTEVDSCKTLFSTLSEELTIRKDQLTNALNRHK